MQVIQLRFRAVCEMCRSKLPPRSEAWHDEASGRTLCPTCFRLEAQESSDAGDPPAPPRLTPDLNRAPPLVRVEPDATSDHDGDHELAPLDLRTDADRLVDAEASDDPDRRGPSAHARRPAYDRESDRPHDGGPLKIPVAPVPAKARGGPRRSRLPQVGPSLAAGLEAERQAAGPVADHGIGRALEAARPHGLEILRSRPWVGTRVDSEAIVVGPSGVWVVDGLGSGDDPIERGFLAGHAGSELLNVVGGRTSVISGLLFDSPFQWVPVRGALCFDAAIPAWFEEPFNLAGIAITTPRDLIDALFTPLHLDAETRRLTAAHLANRF